MPTGKKSLVVTEATHEAVSRLALNLKIKTIQEATERALEIGLKAMAAKAKKRRAR